MSKYLRHKPEEIGIKLADGGWVNIDDLLKGLQNAGFYIGRDTLMQIVEQNDKQRFTVEGERIRAAQGHTTEVDMKFVPATPPSDLWHGTAAKTLTPIFDEGLKPVRRQHVHLSVSIVTAIKVGKRHGSKWVLLCVDALRAHNDGVKFYVADNGVWLADHVPPQYLTAKFIDYFT